MEEGKLCDIVSFTGSNHAVPTLLNGLSQLEHRGYNSAGISVRDGDCPAQAVKAKTEETPDCLTFLGTQVLERQIILIKKLE